MGTVKSWQSILPAMGFAFVQGSTAPPLPTKAQVLWTQERFASVLVGTTQLGRGKNCWKYWKNHPFKSKKILISY